MLPPESDSGAASRPSVAHVSTAADELAGGDAIAAALELVAHEAEPLVATFFHVASEGEIATSIVHGTHLPAAELVRAVQGWKAALRGIDPLAPARLAALDRRVATLHDVGGRAALEDGQLLDVYRHIGVINDVRLPIRDGGRLVAGVTLWRPLRSRSWGAAQLRALEALQPLIELAYLSARRAASGVDARLPATLTARQREVARLLATGATNVEVARALHVSPETAKSHARAVLGKLGVASRREVVKRLTPSATGASPRADGAERAVAGYGGAPAAPRGDGAQGGDRPIEREGAETPGLVLELALGWAARRIHAVTGGCALFSARLEPVADGWAIARPAAYPVDLRLARRVQRQLLPSSRPPEVLRHLAGDPAQWRVLELDVAEHGTGHGRLDELLASSGLTAPLVTVLRLRGRVAGLVWLARDARAKIDQRESARALRRLHPLLELACAPALGETLAPIATPSDLERRGLTPRELAVARLAIAGHGNDAIARRLGVSRSTVKNHMTRVLAKCGVRQRAQLIAVASARAS